jgi:hypothetical protein
MDVQKYGQKMALKTYFAKTNWHAHLIPLISSEFEAFIKEKGYSDSVIVEPYFNSDSKISISVAMSAP